ncbi:MAG TPA: aminodeoxychorismate synthase component I [Rudaea sp.]|nr:aminodeoxychorismate synthase component I [Rudaea sp.]
MTPSPANPPLEGEGFRAGAPKASRLVIRTLDGTRDLLPVAAANPRRYPGLLESNVRGPHARYDILFACPQEHLELLGDGRLHNSSGAGIDGRFLDALDLAWQRERIGRDPDVHLPFRGGWLLFLGYEMAAQIEPRLRLPPAPDADLPIALAVRCPAAIIVDRERDCTHLVAEDAFAGLIDSLEADLDSASEFTSACAASAVDEDAPETFLRGVAAIHEYLRAGDVFQVNLSREWRARLTGDVSPAALFAGLRRANPAPFAGLLQWRDCAVVSSSPERLVDVRGNDVTTRPIAGTRARVGGDDDGARLRELIGHPKERAEHVMLIDLERNDLGRVCVPGSVEVDEFMTLESYAHVHHIVSNVHGILRQNVTPAAIIRAVFPGGTITGCPKVRTMEIIAELEGTGRGAYTGALGYLNRDGDMDLNILIRTFSLCRGDVRLRAGAGIVADSIAAAELDETRAKARGMLRALGIDA